MGAKDSRPSFIQYEEAARRVSESELRRIREAFKRCAGANGSSLSVEAFVHEVLCDGVPVEVAEWLYQACGGTRRGIAFRDLLCGLVVLTKGCVDEKIKFLWTLYVNNQNENGTYIYKWDFARALHMENTSLPVTGAPRTAEILTGLFGAHGDKVGFDQFRSWLLIHKDATVLSKWLLSEQCVNLTSDLETPTFYQSLAGVTHLEERDIIELEKCFWSLRNSAPSGQLDVESLTPLLSPPLPRAAVQGTFLAFDENRDGHVDFKELCCGLSAACRGPRIERLKFCFKIFDMDRDGILNRQELTDMISILTNVANESLKNQNSRSSTPTGGSQYADKPFDPDIVLENLRDKLSSFAPKEEICPSKPVFQLGPTNASPDESDSIDVTPQISSYTDEKSSSEDEGGGEIISYDLALTQEDFLIWSVETAENLVTPFLDLIFEVCHIVLGLRPQCKHQERDIVLGWLFREVRRGYSVGQFWYLVGAEWWASWLGYTAAGSGAGADGAGVEPCCRTHKPIDEAIVCDESFTSNSTESMGSLLGRADTVSLASAASSSGVSSGGSARQHTPKHPGPIDNKRLLASNPYKVRTLTGEGGHLRRDVTLAQHRDFELVPDALWRALSLWYGGPQPLPRQVIRPPNSDVELELYPLSLRLLRHVPSAQRMNSVSGVAGVPVYGGVSLAPSPPAPPERQLAYTAAFSRLATVRQVLEFVCAALGLAREDVRLWQVGGVTGPGGSASSGGVAVCLLDDERPALAELGFEDRQRVLLEVRNRDLTWPEEIGALSLTSVSASTSERRGTLLGPNLPGATGLHNLGNTCFMNAALQSVWNTGPLTRYFNSGMHLYEVNVANPLGTKGALALRYGELCKEVWSCSARSVAPLRVRWCVARHAPQLSGGGQHDAQEMLAWLLDALHEDLNRASLQRPLSMPHKDSDGRADEVVATEAWEAHTTRNKSIMTDLFYGQLKSKVCCDTCGHESVRFDAFNMLSLPLPMESYVHCEIRVMLLDGSVPVKYGIRANSEGLYLDLKKRLSNLCGLTPARMLLVELAGATLGRFLEDNSKIRVASAGELYAYELPDDTDQVDTVVQYAVETNCWWLDERGAPTEGAAWSTEGAAERSRSEILMSQSPPNTFYTNKSAKEEASFNGVQSTPKALIDKYSNTLPKDISARETSKTESSGNSPTLSVKSLNLKTESPHLKRLKYGSSPSNMDRLNENSKEIAPLRVQYLVAVHRKQCRQDTYFLSQHKSRPALFGIPLLVPLREGMSGRQLYSSVWSQVERLLSAQPPTPPDQSNHATDCDDSLGYAFPFTLRVVSGAAGGAWCALCAWPRFCRGCALPCTDQPLVLNLRPRSGTIPRPKRTSTSSIQNCPMLTTSSDSPIAKAKHNRLYGRGSMEDNTEAKPPVECDINCLDFNEIRQIYSRPLRNGATNTAQPLMLAIDWDPTALHLRYQSTREKAWVEHESVYECTAEGAKPVGLTNCLSAFTAEEKLEQPYHCSGCRSAQPATKKLQIWRLPPILIIHLKRFQYVNSKWIKSQKVVNFPYQNFDPTAYLASVPQETILRHQELKFMFRRRSSMFNYDVDSRISESELSDDEDVATGTRIVQENAIIVQNKTKPVQENTKHIQENTKPSQENMKSRADRNKRRESTERNLGKEMGRARLESTSLVTTPISDDNLVDYHKHHLMKGEDPFDLKYRLYAVVSHSGQMSGGHYVAYARNPTGSWLCYNDSSCRELSLVKPSSQEPDGIPPIDPSSAYLLFYERQGLDYEPYLPDIEGREPVLKENDVVDGDDSDLKKMCVIS